MKWSFFDWLVLVAVASGLWFAIYMTVRTQQKSEACEADGGVYVKTAQGWACLEVKRK